MKSLEPARTAPSGAPRPLVKSSQTVSQPAVMSLGGDAQGDGGVQHAGAVHVDLHAVFVGDVGDGVQSLDRPAGAAALVGGLLDLHQFLRRGIAGDGADGGLQGLRR